MSPVTCWGAEKSGLPLGPSVTPAQAQAKVSRVGQSYPSSSHMLAALGPHCEVLVSTILTVLHEKMHITCLFDRR